MVAVANHGPEPRVGPLVRFRVRDVYLPAPGEVLERLDGEVELVGTLVELSDSGDRPGEFGVVRLADGIQVVVPVVALTEMREG